MPNSNTIQAVTLEGDYVWAGTSGGLICWNRFDGSYVKYTLADGLPTNDIWDIAIDTKGQKWLATPAGVVRFDGQTWHTFTTADGLADDLVWAIVVDPAIWPALLLVAIYLYPKIEPTLIKPRFVSLWQWSKTTRLSQPRIRYFICAAGWDARLNGLLSTS